jgi:hypothetical protein
MSETVYAERRIRKPFPLGFGGLTLLLALLFFFSIPACWALGNIYGWDRRVASNTFYLVFFVVYAGVLALPWLNLAGQEGLTPEQRLGKMCVAWICLEIAAAIFWSGPWLLFPATIVAAKGQMWAYGWWAYMDGGDTRYTVTDAGLLAMENMGIVTATACAIILVRRLMTGRFTDVQLVALILFQLTEFGVIATYYVSGFHLNLSELGGFWGITIKYIGSNIFWLVMPCVVFYWAGQLLLTRRAEAAGAGR